MVGQLQDGNSSDGDMPNKTDWLHEEEQLAECTQDPTVLRATVSETR